MYFIKQKHDIFANGYCLNCKSWGIPESKADDSVSPDMDNTNAVTPESELSANLPVADRHSEPGYSHVIALVQPSETQTVPIGDDGGTQGGNPPQEVSDDGVIVFNRSLGHFGTKKELMDYFIDKTKSAEDYVQHLEVRFQHSFPKYAYSKIVSAVRTCKSSIKRKLKGSHGHRERVAQLFAPFEIHIPAEPTPVTDDTGTRRSGRPAVSFQEAGYSGKRARISAAVKQAESLPPDKVIIGILRRSDIPNKDELIKINKYCVKSPSKSLMASKALERPNQTPCSTEEALGLILDEGFSKRQYLRLREDARVRGYDLYPPYDRVAEAKKSLRPPEASITVTETCASVTLQALLDHTCSRILEMQNEILEQILQLSDADFTVFCSWGFDGSSGQVNYKQRYYGDSQGPHGDSWLFATTCIPLQISQTESGRVLWRNPTPQSVRFCRPVDLEFIKESTNVIEAKRHKYQEQIDALEPFILSRNGKLVRLNGHGH